MTKSEIPFHPPTEVDIQQKAYRLWVEGGCHEGLDQWLSAKKPPSGHNGQVDCTPALPANPNVR